MVMVIVMVMVFVSTTTAYAKNDFAKKTDGGYFTGNYYISESETVFTDCSRIECGAGTIIRASTICLRSINGNGKTAPLFYTLVSSDQNNIVMILDEDMEVYLPDGGYTCTVFNNSDEYLSTLQQRCNIAPNMVFHIDNKMSTIIQLIRFYPK